MLPPITTKATAKVKNTIHSGVQGSLGNLPRLNFSSKTEIGNSVMTMSHISENLSERGSFNVSGRGQVPTNRLTSSRLSKG